MLELNDRLKASLISVLIRIFHYFVISITLAAVNQAGSQQIQSFYNFCGHNMCSKNRDMIRACKFFYFVLLSRLQLIRCSTHMQYNDAKTYLEIDTIVL